MVARHSVDIKSPVTLDSSLRNAELEIARLFGGAAFTLSPSDGSGIRRTDDIPSSGRVWTLFDTIVDYLVAQRLNCCLVIGMDTPNWANWKAATGGSWGSEKNRPPPEAWPYWVADAQAARDRMVSKYETAGLVPSRYCAVQTAREVCKGSPGGPWVTSGPFAYSAPYSSLADGTWDQASDIGGSGRNLHAQLAYFHSNFNRGDLALIGPSVESQDLTQERATIPNGTWLASPDYWALDCYPIIDWSRAWTIVGSVNACYDDIMTTVALIRSSVSAWATKPCCLMEYGGTNSKLRLASRQNAKYSHARRGEILSRLQDRLHSSGEFGWLNFYVARERDAGVAEADIYALMDSTGAANYAYRVFNRKKLSSGEPTAPSGGYVAGSSETSTF